MISRLVRLLPRGGCQRIMHTRPEFDHFAKPDWHAHIMAEPITDKLHVKQGRSIARWTLAKRGERLAMFLKRHYDLGWRAGLLARLMPRFAWTPALQEWHNLAWAVRQGLPVAEPLAVCEWRGPWLKLQGCLAIRELDGMLPLHEAVPLACRSLTPHLFHLWKRKLVAELARLSAKLHRMRVYHKDLYLCHFYLPAASCRVVPATMEQQIVMIDFHRLGRHAMLAWYFQLKDLAQLLYSTVDVQGITDRDRQRFWLHYRRQLGPLAACWLRWAVGWKYRLYLRHARRRRARSEG